jgi:hypothetical protein
MQNPNDCDNGFYHKMERTFLNDNNKNLVVIKFLSENAYLMNTVYVLTVLKIF